MLNDENVVLNISIFFASRCSRRLGFGKVDFHGWTNMCYLIRHTETWQGRQWENHLCCWRMGKMKLLHYYPFPRRFTRSWLLVVMRIIWVTSAVAGQFHGKDLVEITIQGVFFLFLCSLFVYKWVIFTWNTLNITLISKNFPLLSRFRNLIFFAHEKSGLLILESLSGYQNN